MNGLRAARNYFFLGADPEGCPALAKPAGVVGPAPAFSFSFFGFLASLLLRICPLAIDFLQRSNRILRSLAVFAKGEFRGDRINSFVDFDAGAATTYASRQSRECFEPREEIRWLPTFSSSMVQI